MGGAFPVGPVILGYLRLGGPTHGYQLLARIHRDLSGVWRVAPSQLYATLARLENEGLVRGTREEQENRPARTRYALTERGEALFWQWVHTPVPRVRLLRSELLPKIFFLQKLAPERLPELLALQKDALLALKTKVAAERPADPFQEVLRNFRLAQLSAGLQWIETLLAEQEVA
jgi:DNA-binding PadR family transcriptional regulator